MASRTRAAAPTTQASYAYDALRRDIISGQLAGGERIRQAEWAESLQISITPVREAIRRLEQDGLVVSTAHRGTTVLGLTLDRAEEIYAMRFRVEPLQIARAMGKMTEADALRARALCDEMGSLSDVIEFTELNEQFHRITMAYDDSWTSHVVTLLAAAASPYVSRSLQLDPRQIEASNAQHYAMLEAFIDQDEELATKIELEHLRSTLVILRKHFT